MKELDPSQLHPDVGSVVFQYWHPEPRGGWTRRCFYIKPGDNPDFWLAERLMPGAAKGESLVGVFGIEDEDEANSFQVFLPVYRSCFETRIYADSPEELAFALDVIGGLQLSWLGSPNRSVCDEIKLICRYYWERRPILRRRSPLDRF